MTRKEGFVTFAVAGGVCTLSEFGLGWDWNIFATFGVFAIVYTGAETVIS